MPRRHSDPAFPRSPTELSFGRDSGHTGMSLLDWFAGMALLGIIANGTEGPPRSEDGPDIAERAYDIAEAMLAER